MDLAVLTILAWVVVVGSLMLFHRLWEEASAPLADVLRDSRAEAVAAFDASLKLRLSLVQQACERAVEARGLGRAEEARQLAEIALATADVLVPQIQRRLQEWDRYAGLLDAADAPSPPDTGAGLPPATTGRLGRWLLAATRGRLRWHLLALRIALALTRRRLRRALRLPTDRTDAWAHLPAAHAELEALSQATVAAYRSLLLSLQACRDTLETYAASGRPH